MTDAVIEAYGTTLEETFENAAKALCDTMIDLKTVRPKERLNFLPKAMTFIRCSSTGWTRLCFC